MKRYQIVHAIRKNGVHQGQRTALIRGRLWAWMAELIIPNLLPEVKYINTATGAHPNVDYYVAEASLFIASADPNPFVPVNRYRVECHQLRCASDGGPYAAITTIWYGVYKDTLLIWPKLDDNV